LTTLPQFGVFMLAYSVGLVTGILAGLGAPTRVLRAGADHQSTPGALYVVYSTLVVGSFAVCGLVYVAAAPHPAAYAGLVLALGDTLVNFAVSYMTADDRHIIANSLVLFHRLVPLAAVVIGYFVMNRGDFALLTVALCIPVLVALAIPVMFIPIRQSVRQWRSPFMGGIGYWAYSMSALIGQLQAPVLAAVTSASVVATYTMAAKVVGPISILTGSVSVVAVPELVKRIASPPRFDRLFRGLLVLSVAYLVVVAVAAWPIAQLVVYAVGPQYLTAEPIVIGMVLGAGISGCSQAFNSRLLALGRPFAASMAITAGALVALVGLAILGSIGLVNVLWLVPIATEIVVIVIMVMASRRGYSNFTTR
jgi:O-antigen/teichoic acid export membrane protein